MHMKIRRIALGFAGFSFSLLTALVLCFSACCITEKPVGESEKQGLAHSFNITPLKMPAGVEGTDLLLHNLAIYDGPFYEDGTGREVMGVAAVLIENRGDSMLSLIHLEVQTLSCKYEFEAMMIPPCSRVLVPEKYAREYVHEGIIQCNGWTVDAKDMPAYPITVTPMSIGTLRITNISDEPLQNIHLYHKTYLKESDIFVGGIVFETVVPYIAPRSFSEVRPECYASGYSELLYVG